MTRVVSLYLPNWSIDRIVRAERRNAPSTATRPDAAPDAAHDPALLALKQAGDAEQGGKACDSPKNTGWRPGARWARADDESTARWARADDEGTARQVRAGDEGTPRWSRVETEAELKGCQAGYADPHPMVSTAWARDAAAARVRVGPDDAAALSRPLAGVDEATGGASGVLANGQPSRREDFIADVPPVSACWGGETRADVARRIARLPAHQQPPMREMGRRSEAADNPYKRLPGDDGGKSTGWPEPAMPALSACRRLGVDMAAVRFGGEGVRPTSVQRRDPRVAAAAWNQMPAIRYPGDGPHPDKRAARERRPVETRGGSNDAGAAVPPVAAFFDTGRSTAGTVARVCRDDALATDFAPLVPATRAPAPAIVTAHKVGARVEIAAASPAARALGAEPGMALTQLRAAVPDVAVRDADPAGDAAELERLALALARRWSPVVAIDGADGVAIDIAGVAHLHGGEEAMAARLVRLLARMGIAARIGIADTLGAAWALARHAADGDARVIVLDEGAGLDALAALPVAAMRVPAAAEELLRRLGIDTVGQLAALPRAPTTRRFGRAVIDRLDQAAGRLAEPLDPVIPAEPIVVEQRFAEPLLTAEPIAHWLGRLVPRLTAQLAAAGRGARAVVLAAHRLDAAVQTIRLGFARPVRDDAHIARLLLRQVERIDPGFGIETLALHVLRADPLGAEPLAGDLATGTAPDLAPLVDAIVARIGTRRLWRTRPLASDVPERSVRTAAPLDPPDHAAPRLKAHDVRHLDRTAADHPWHPRWPRPTRLLRRPEPLDHVTALLPDYPPVRFTWRGTMHRVVHGDGPERIAGEWWRHPAERDAVRDYFLVEDDAGQRFWLFRRGDGEHAATGDLSWYMHGTFA